MKYNENEIEFCENCDSENFDKIIIDRIDNIICEYNIVCLNCEEIVNYWAYGFHCNNISAKYLKMKKNRNRKKKLEQIIKYEN